MAADEKKQQLETFENYQSKHFDLYDKVKHNTLKQKTSILEDIDFE